MTVTRARPTALAAALAGALALLSAPASAEELGVFRDWTAHKITVEGEVICFMESRPTKLDAKPADRNGETVRVTVSNRPAREIVNALLFETGYPLDQAVMAEVAIDGNRYQMGTDAGGYFYLSEIKDEQRLLDAMKAGRALTAKGTMPDGTPITDAYSLSGFTAALKAIDGGCPK